MLLLLHLECLRHLHQLIRHLLVSGGCEVDRIRAPQLRQIFLAGIPLQPNGSADADNVKVYYPLPMGQVPQPAVDLGKRVAHLGCVACCAEVGDVLPVITAFALDIPRQRREGFSHPIPFCLNQHMRAHTKMLLLSVQLVLNNICGLIPELTCLLNHL